MNAVWLASGVVALMVGLLACVKGRTYVHSGMAERTRRARRWSSDTNELKLETGAMWVVGVTLVVVGIACLVSGA